MKKTILLSIICLTAFTLVSCTGAITDFSGTWKKPGYTAKKYNKILVVAISNDLVKRNSVESAVVRSLSDQKINSTTSSSILDLSNIEKDKNGKADSTKLEVVKKTLRDAGYDGALVVSLLDIKEKTEYVPGSTYYQPNYYGFYGGAYAYSGFYNYSYNTYNVVNTPGYYVQKTNIFLETRMFDLTTEDLVWAAQSETGNPANLKELSGSYGVAIADELISKKIIK